MGTHAKPRADRVPVLVSVANRGSMTNTFSSAAARNSWASVLGPNAGSWLILSVLPCFAVVRPAPLIRPEQTRAAACHRHVGAADCERGGTLALFVPLRVFVVSHGTMLIALSPWLRRPYLLAFWRQPMGGSVPLKTVASNYFPRRARPFGACARLLARRYRSK
jgi:hypothetical protein